LPLASTTAKAVTVRNLVNKPARKIANSQVIVRIYVKVPARVTLARKWTRIVLLIVRMHANLGIVNLNVNWKQRIVLDARQTVKLGHARMPVNWYLARHARILARLEQSV